MAKKIFKPEVDYQSDLILIGISCHLNDYRLVHYLNKYKNLNLTRYEDLEIFYLPSDKNKFPFYYYFSEEDYLAYNFISNRTPDRILLSEYKHLDYILIINGATHNYDTDSLISYIKQIQNVLTVAALKFEVIKNIKPILEDIELHVIEILKGNEDIE